MEHTLRNLKIKAASCKRLVKELDSYVKEVKRETAKTQGMKRDNADPYDLKQQENVLAESRMMIPDCHQRLEAALADLKAVLVELNDDKSPEALQAQDVIAEVECVLRQNKPNQEGTEVEEAGEVKG